MAEPLAKKTADLLGSSLLDKAELLLAHAAEAGIHLEKEVLDSVLAARFARAAGPLPEPVQARLLVAFTKLAARVSPVTVESLRASEEVLTRAKNHLKISGFDWFYIAIAFFIVLFSVLSFVCTTLSGKLKQDVDTANTLLSKLRVELGPWPVNGELAAKYEGWTGLATNNSPGDVWFWPRGIPAGVYPQEVIDDLQQFAATMRQIDGYTRQLVHCLPGSAATNLPGGTNLELTIGLYVPLAKELTDKAAQYERVRGNASRVEEQVTVLYGAVANSILPVFYALLGAGAYVLRSYQLQLKNRTFTSFKQYHNRFFVAGIGGLVVGLFNNVTDSVNFSPFAIAFLAGYGVDVFFTFLEGFLQIFKRSQENTIAPGMPE